MELLLGNDHHVQVTGLKNGLDDAAVSAATLSLTVLDSTGTTEVSGVSWPVTLAPVSGSPGDYAGVLPREVAITLGAVYTVRVEISDSGTGLDAQFDALARCKRRKY